MSNIKKQSKRKFHTVYQTINLKNNMLYIGAHSTDLVEDSYLGSGNRLILAIEKYGVESFSKTILYVFSTPEEMFKKEAEIVNIEFLKRPDVYNIVEGGFGGFNKGTTGLKHLHHPSSNKRCAVHPNSIPKMIAEGWVVGRNISPTTNTIWIYKGNDKKMISIDEFENYINNGWVKGLLRSPTKDKVWIFNKELNEYSLCSQSDLTNYLTNGWIKKKWAPIPKGNCWINNSQENLRVPKDNLESYLSNGWVKGMITTRWN
jgi:hypothetical protein